MYYTYLGNFLLLNPKYCYFRYLWSERYYYYYLLHIITKVNLVKYIVMRVCVCQTGKCDTLNAWFRFKFLQILRMFLE